MDRLKGIWEKIIEFWNKFKSENGEVKGLKDEFGQEYLAPVVILTTGTSLEARIWVGLQYLEFGRLGEASAKGLSPSLQKLGFNYLTEMKNPQFPKLNCWVYENTPEFDLAFESLMKEADGNGR